MLLMKFFQIIDNSFLGKFIDNKLNLIAAIDPDRIYVENIRSFYSLPTSVAKMFCEMAYKENLFKKNIAVECPNESCERVIEVYNTKQEIPDLLECEHCLLLEKDKYKFKKNEMNFVEFYQLNRNVL